MAKGSSERHKVHKAVIGGLREAIKAHGPITKVLIGSAAKRIVGTMMARKGKARDEASKVSE